jgi:hypothetical protein
MAKRMVCNHSNLNNEVKWCSIGTCIMKLEFFFKDYYFSLESFSVWICMQKLWTYNVTKKNQEFLGFPFGVLRIFVNLMQSPPPITKFIIGRRVVTPPKSKPWWILWTFVVCGLSVGPNSLRCNKFYHSVTFFCTPLSSLILHTKDTKWIYWWNLKLWWSKILYCKIFNIFWFTNIHGDQNIGEKKFVKEWVLFIFSGTP